MAQKEQKGGTHVLGSSMGRRPMAWVGSPGRVMPSLRADWRLSAERKERWYPSPGPTASTFVISPLKAVEMAPESSSIVVWEREMWSVLVP